MAARVGLVLIASALANLGQGAATSAAPETANPAKYTLRYRFRPGETLRWEVVHQASVRTSVGGMSQTVDTVTHSEKVWRIKEVDPQGIATFEHSVENVQMRRSSGDQTVRYDSRTDTKPPPGFESVAKSLGKTLATVTMDPQGKVLKRQRTAVPGPSSQDGQMTVPLPAEPIPVGHSWAFPYEIAVSASTGLIKRIRLLQKFTLDEVSSDVAVIRVVTQVLTPVNDPAIEAKLVQYQSAGTIRFDLHEGRVLGQQVDVDRHVVGFRGEVSSLHYLTRFSEKFQPAARVAAKP